MESLGQREDEKSIRRMDRKMSIKQSSPTLWTATGRNYFAAAFLGAAVFLAAAGVFTATAFLAGTSVLAAATLGAAAFFAGAVAFASTGALTGDLIAADFIAGAAALLSVAWLALALGAAVFFADVAAADLDSTAFATVGFLADAFAADWSTVGALAGAAFFAGAAALAVTGLATLALVAVAFLGAAAAPGLASAGFLATAAFWVGAAALAVTGSAAAGLTAATFLAVLAGLSGVDCLTADSLSLLAANAVEGFFSAFLAGLFTGLATGISDSLIDKGFGRKAFCLKHFHAFKRRIEIVVKKKRTRQGPQRAFTKFMQVSMHKNHFGNKISSANSASIRSRGWIRCVCWASTITSAARGREL